MPKWIVNPETPRPCPIPFESIREVAMERWGDVAIDERDIFRWVCSGCPNSQGALLSAKTKDPPVPGQGVTDSHLFVNQLFEAGIFLSVVKQFP